MVLVLAALYTYYHQLQQQKREQERDPNERNNNINNNDNTNDWAFPGVPVVVVPNLLSTFCGVFPVVAAPYDDDNNDTDSAATTRATIATTSTSTNSTTSPATNNNDNNNDMDSGSVSSEQKSTNSGSAFALIDDDEDDNNKSDNTSDTGVFRESVRDEWINAVFGRDFLPNGAASNTSTSTSSTSNSSTIIRGVGLSGIASYVAHTVHISTPKSTATRRNKTTSTTTADSTADNTEEPAVAAAAAAAAAAASFDTSNEKLGMTMTRLPLGLYVNQVEVASEAFYAGVQEEAVLISVNGIPFLGEPSRQALERIWQYEGVFQQQQQQQQEGDGTRGSPSTLKREEQKEASSGMSSHEHRVNEPVALEFIYKGQLSTVLMLSNPPWGISWAPCGNFCLVKRVYSHAAQAGVKRGCLVASCNQKSFRALDHANMAMTIRDEFAACHDMELTLCVTPTAARTGHYERQLQNQLANGKSSTTTALTPSSAINNYSVLPLPPSRVSWTTKTHDGVEVKFHSLECALGNLCNYAIMGAAAAASSSSPSNSNYNSKLNHSAVEELASKVAAGTIRAPTGMEARNNINNNNINLGQQGNNVLVLGDVDNNNNRIYSPCPALPPNRLLEAWDPLVSLLYCLRLHAANYDEERFALILSHPQQQQTEVSSLEAIRFLTSRPYATDIVGSFLLQFIGIICAPSEMDDVGGRGEEEVEDEKKTDESLEPRAHLLPKGKAQELTSILLKVSRKDEGFCQRLYFLLRSYISTLENPRPQSNREDGSRNLVALLNCLGLLRFAENELAGRTRSPSNGTMSSKPSPPQQLPGEDETLVALTSIDSCTGSGAARAVQQQQQPPPPSSSPATSPASPCRSMNTQQSQQSAASTTASSKRRLFGRFRKKKKLPNTTELAPPEPMTQPITSSQCIESRHNVGSKSVVSPMTVNSPLSSRRNNKAKVINTRPSESFIQSPSVMYENMSEFLTELDRVCGTIERSLQKSFRQKMADWAMSPWSPSKDSALAEVTATMRKSLEEGNKADSNRMILVNPVDSSELLSSVDYDECYILPSAHFPILLTFNVSERRTSDQITGEERLYRTKVELVSLKGYQIADDHSFLVHAAVAGSISESGTSRKVRPGSSRHIWQKGGTLIFDGRSSWGAPQTLALRLSTKQAVSPDSSYHDETEEIGYGWVDLSAQFNMSSDETTTTCYAEIWLADSRVSSFDEHGDLPNDTASAGSIELKLKITTESIGFGDDPNDGFIRKRMLLYKHDDDLRQEAFAVQFISTCDAMLNASGLDMELLTFQCIPVGTKRGFVEWVPGSVPLSEICHPFAGSILGADRSDGGFPSMFTKAGLTKYESLRRLGGQQNESLRRLSGNHGSNGSFSNNPIQDYLRSVAYDPHAPYLIRRKVMDTYVKSCAGYTVITYILGVGDRHLDNLLLHQSGAIFHCDYSFILGSDPKMYLPVRVTEDMVYGLGGRDSDNYVRFLSMVGAAFLCLRRPENVRVLLSMVRLMEFSCVPDISENQTTEDAITGLRDRLRLELSEQEAVAYMEELVESSQSSKMWIAVDAIHSLGKKF